MLLEILRYPHPTLKKKAKEVGKITPEIKELIFNMKETLKKAQGVGLAAPQIGESLRVIVVETKGGPLGFVNPKIIKKTKKNEIGEEGCLCLPSLFLKIKRPQGVEVKALDEQGKVVQIKAEGLLARVFQHEFDHLNGKLIIDRVSFWQRWKVIRSLTKK